MSPNEINNTGGQSVQTSISPTHERTDNQKALKFNDALNHDITSCSTERNSWMTIVHIFASSQCDHVVSATAEMQEFMDDFSRQKFFSLNEGHSLREPILTAVDKKKHTLWFETNLSWKEAFVTEFYHS